MGSVNSLSDTSDEDSSLGIGHIMESASEWNLNVASAIKQTTDPEVFRFLDLPRELRDKIYGNLLIHHKTIELKRSKLFQIGQKCRYYETRLRLAPQICRTSKEVALESLPVLYGENTFHSTVANNIRVAHRDLGLNTYSHLIKSIQVDTFRSDFMLSMQSTYWAVWDPFTQLFDNLKKLRFSLPQELEILTGSNKDALLKTKRFAPKCAVVEFCGANPAITLQLLTSWSKHVPREIEYPKREPQPFNPLQLSRKQVREHNRETSKQMLSPPVSMRNVRTATFKRPLPDGFSSEKLQTSKKQKLDGETPCFVLDPLSGSSGLNGKGGSKSNTEAGLHNSDEMGLAVEEERTLTSQEKSLMEEIVALEKKQVAIEKEGLALKRKKLALEKKKLVVQGAKTPPSPASSTVST